MASSAYRQYRDRDRHHYYHHKSDEPRVITVGICAMGKKLKSKPMREILLRLATFELLRIIEFDENVILNEPVDKWPLCDGLISFHSKGFPLEKAEQYAKLRSPFLVNDLEKQWSIQDRRRVYSILKKARIDHPRYAILNRDDESEPSEEDDRIEVNGEVFHKPLVEKPVSADDHNVFIYFSSATGGGTQRLFRKIGSRSSVYSAESRVRRVGSYIYEEFMPTDGTDVKVYTVGPEYAHAEARKSPALDGKVERDKEGKEIRYPVMLSAKEKLMARKVVLAFKQNVCGFDLLRANGKSYVCDVNGFSFVKTSNKYYDDCAKILGNLIMKELGPKFNIPWSLTWQPEDPPIMPTTSGTMMELRCVIAIIRHADRTPKQKMKMEVKHPKFFELFKRHEGFKTGKIKLKQPKHLQEVLDIVRSLLQELEATGQVEFSETEEKKGKLEQIKSVLEMYGHFSGINRKVQLKFQPHGRPKRSSDDDRAPGEPSLLLIIKWGGELTAAGKQQAEELGRAFRCIYPGGQGEYRNNPELGLLRLHSTFRHDLKIYASDEGRVQMTAAAFAKGMLALEGELPPILAQMVKSANMNGLLDDDRVSAKFQNAVKQKLKESMQMDALFGPPELEKLAPTRSKSLLNAIAFVRNPVAACRRIHLFIHELTEFIRRKINDNTASRKLYHNETWELMLRRWSKLEKDYMVKNGKYEISKIPDIYDCIKYDLQHNAEIVQFQHAEELFSLSKALADIVIPQEYGMTRDEKLGIAQGIIAPLLRKIRTDLQRNMTGNFEFEDESVNKLDPNYSKGIQSPERHVRTRLYFTSESHIHSLLNVLRYGGICDAKTQDVNDEQWSRAMEYVSAVPELNYISQIVIMLYENPQENPDSENRFHVELHFSPGAINRLKDKHDLQGRGYRPQSREGGGGKGKGSDCSDHEQVHEEEQEYLESDDWGGKGSEGQFSPDHEPATSFTYSKTRPTTSSPCRSSSDEEADTVSPPTTPRRRNKRIRKPRKPRSSESSEDGERRSTSSGAPAKRREGRKRTTFKDAGQESSEENRSSPDESRSYLPLPTRKFEVHSVDAGSVDSPRSRQESNDSCRPSDSSSSGNNSTKERPSASQAINISKPSSKEAVDDSNDARSRSFDETSERDGASVPCGRQVVKGQDVNVSLIGERTRSVVGSGTYHTVHGLGGQELLKAMRLFLASDTSPGLFSTRVIRGSNSSPDLDRVNYEKPIVSIPDGTCVVPSISPLETLHNALSLKQVDRFLSRMTDMSMRTPFSTPPLYPSTPVTPFLEVSNTFIPGPEVTSKAGSGRSSPVMPPAKDIAERLEKLVRDDKVVDTPTATPSQTPNQTPR